MASRTFLLVNAVASSSTSTVSSFPMLLRGDFILTAGLVWLILGRTTVASQDGHTSTTLLVAHSTSVSGAAGPTGQSVGLDNEGKMMQRFVSVSSRRQTAHDRAAKAQQRRRYVSSAHFERTTLNDHPALSSLARRGAETQPGNQTTRSVTQGSANITGITGAPAWSNKTTIDGWQLPDGHTAGIPTTTCSYDDTQCRSLCASSWEPCHGSWSSWSHYDISYTSTPYTSTHSYTYYSSSYSITTSIETGARDSTISYALGSGIPDLTVSGVQVFTFWDHEVVVSTMKPPPTCSWAPCVNAAKANPATCRSCDVQGGTVELLYWADMATSTRSSNVSHTQSRPITALYKNTTLTSPTVYIDFKTAYATNACGKTVGNTYPGAILGIDPNSLYSIQAQFDYFVEPLDEGEATSTFYQSALFDFHNLEGLVPASVYRAQPSCLANGCYTIFNDYRPVLVRIADSFIQSID